MDASDKHDKWTGRSRILAAFNQTQADRVPRFDQTVYSNVASAVLGRELLVGGGSLRFAEVEATFAGDGAAVEFEGRLLEDVAYFYRVMEYDMARLPWRDTRKATARLDRYTYFFGDQSKREPWEICRYAPESHNWHTADNWLAGGDVDRLCDHLKSMSDSWTGPDKDPERFNSLKRFKELVGEDLALAASVGGLGIPMWEPAWLMAVLVAPELVADELDRQCEQALEDLILASRIGVDVALAGMDCCLNTGPAYSPESFERLLVPRLKRITAKCDEVGIRYVFRTDGKTWPLAELLFGDSGVHGYGEIDFQAGMRLVELRERFPGLCLLGNLDCGGALVRGNAQEVRQAVRANLEETGGIGHIFGSSNSIMPETPPENYLAMLDEAARYRP
jgi:Uroporphyrinogen decarboxylase (URO-D)